MGRLKVLSALPAAAVDLLCRWCHSTSELTMAPLIALIFFGVLILSYSYEKMDFTRTSVFTVIFLRRRMSTNVLA